MIRADARDAEGMDQARLQQAGWTLDRAGKHQVKMTKPGRRPITLPENKRRAYSKGFEAQLRREAGLQDKQP
jgi:hypothetical protein